MSREMKNSGIEWIGQIPQHWIALPNKYLMKKLKMILSRYNDEPILSLTMDGVIVRDLDAGGKMPTSFDGYQKISKGNLLMCLFDIDVTPRCIGLIKQDGVTSPAYSQFVLNAGNYAPYYYYLYLYLDNDKLLLPLAKNLRHSLTEDVLGEIPMIQPPLSEQQSIANYLDFKCSQIDQLSDNIKQQIEELGEYKKALITQAVTKGLDPDVEMKDSGIKWVGEIPSDWSISKLKYVASIIGGNGFPEYLQGEDTDEIPFYKAGDISAAVRKISDSRTYISRIIADKHRFNLIPSGAILMPKIGEAMKKNSRALSTKICCIDNNCQAIVPSNQVEQDYCYYLLCIVDMNDFDNAGTIPSLNNSKLLNLQIPFPPKKTQHAIANYLDSKCSQIDALIQTKSEILNVLQEYKKSLIFDYVTGKKEVPVSYRKDGCHE